MHINSVTLKKNCYIIELFQNKQVITLVTSLLFILGSVSFVTFFGS